MPPPVGTYLPIHEFAAQELTAPEFVIDPYIPSGGTVLLHGESSVGKSPLTWVMADAIATDRPLFGRLPVKPGRVLYIEADGTPKNSLVARVRGLPNLPENNWDVYFSPRAYDFLTRIDEVTRELEAISKTGTFACVFVNTMRYAYDGDEKDSMMPVRLYNRFHTVFQGAAVVFTHHDNKVSGDPRNRRPNKDVFAGHKAWFNHATSGLHLRFNPAKGEGWRELEHTKCQVAAKYDILDLHLAEDGQTWALDYVDPVVQRWGELSPSKSVGERLELIGKAFNKSDRTIRRRLAKAGVEIEK